MHASVTHATVVNPNGIKTLLTNRLIITFIKGNPVFSNGPRSIPRNPADCITLDDWDFDSLISLDEWFAKSSRFNLCII